MSLRILGLVVLLVLTILVASPAGSWAQNITVDIGPGVCTLSGTSPLNFPNPYTCGNITITPKGAGSANVTAIDGNLDILKFINAKITANQPVSDFHIVVTREFVPGPSTTVAPVYYKTSANGSFSAPKLGNVLTVKTTVTDIVTSTTQQMALLQDSDGDANSNTIGLPPVNTPNTKWLTPPHLSGNRILKTDFWFTLNNATNWMDLTSVMLENKATSGDGDDPPPLGGGGDGVGGGGGENR